MTPVGGLSGQSMIHSPVHSAALPPTAGIDGIHGDFPQQQSIPTGGAATIPQPPFPPTSSTYTQASNPTAAISNDNLSTDIAPLKPVFGVSLDDLLKRDGSAIPLVVYQCLQAVDLFGLEVEGIYRLSGSALHVTKLRTIFDHGESERYL